MPIRATKRGDARTPLDRDCDVLICGASFAGLAVARELAASGADVLVIDRYEIGERQTSACGIPTAWLQRLDLQDALQQTFGELVIHTPHKTVNYRLPWTFSTFDYRALCGLLADQGTFAFETATVSGRSAKTVHTDRGDIRAAHVVDALGWRRMLGSGANIQPPEALLSRGLEVHPHGSGSDMEIWIDRSYVPAGYGWSFPAADEVRIGVGSFDPRFHVREPTERLAGELQAPAVRYGQGNAFRLTPLMTDRVSERRRAAQLARHYRDQDGLTIAEIARRLGARRGHREGLSLRSDRRKGARGQGALPGRLPGLRRADQRAQRQGRRVCLLQALPSRGDRAAMDPRAEP
jgi:menaquinone-9 beta-reductase